MVGSAGHEGSGWQGKQGRRSDKKKKKKREKERTRTSGMPSARVCLRLIDLDLREQKGESAHRDLQTPSLPALPDLNSLTDRPPILLPDLDAILSFASTTADHDPLDSLHLPSNPIAPLVNHLLRWR
jgi:hypothetical protein